MSNIAEKITNIIVDKLGVDAADVNPDANFPKAMANFISR